MARKNNRSYRQLSGGSSRNYHPGSWTQKLLKNLKKEAAASKANPPAQNDRKD